MFVRCSAVIVLVFATAGLADVFSYEADSFPDRAGWDLLQNYCNPDLSIEDGWFHQHVELCPDDPPPGGQQASYRRSLEEYIGVDTFFLEWVVETDADRTEIPWGGGAAFSAWSQGAVNYRFFITSDQAKLNRDNTLPIIFVDIEPGLPHNYRLELYGAELYVWYIDGEIVDSGLPEGEYPSFNPNVNMRAKAAWLPNTTRWDYIRWGQIPPDGSGDFNSDGEVDSADLPFFQECLTTEAGSWPGCAWADMDFDGDTDCDDGQLFIKAWTSPAAPPCIPTCTCDPADFNADGTVNASDLAFLLGAWGPCDKNDFCPADLNDDNVVNAADLAILLGNWG